MTDKLRAAAEMALEALEDVQEAYGNTSEWFRDRVEALRQALDQLPDTTKMIDTGIDRGAWDDVPDATKWVDELRGDETEPFGWLFKQADGDLYKLLRGEDAKWHEKNNPSWIKVSPLYTAPPKDVVEPVAWIVPDYGFLFPNEDSAQRYLDNIESNAAPTPLYTAPPKREWQSLTDDDLEDVFPAIVTYTDSAKSLYRSIAKAVESKLREKNT